MLVPIFVAFVVTHVIVIADAVGSHAHELRRRGRRRRRHEQRDRPLGFLTIAIAFLRAFSLGGGTFTGIEAVSNGLQILREPKVETGKRTMRYMAISLAFTAAGILVAFLLVGVDTSAAGR